ncbi:hypothetical protein GC163_14290 [bacterium]|nr:hypothetical protein [bacterium]
MTEQRERVAIVGRGGVFPGAQDLTTFWQNIAAGHDAGRNVSADRWALSPEKCLAPGGPQPDRVYSTWCCSLDDIAEDWSGLAISVNDVNGLDPLFRIGLTAAAMAWRDARQPRVDPQRVGTIFGHIVLPTEATSALSRQLLLSEFGRRVLGLRDAVPSSSEWSPRNWQAAGLPAAIIATALGFQGPSYTLDAACASSLYALKLACDELLENRADVMVAGGLSRPDCQYTQMGFAQLQALTKSGRCAPLSAAADGLVVGEGAGLFVLKRLSDAVRDGDHIYATIAGIGLSNDRGANLLAPRSEGQLRAMQAAYRQAGWQPGDVDLIECHATGTPIGDGVELDSLHALWHDTDARAGQCVLGSVKSNVGHLLTGAGGVSLMKLLAALEHHTLPPTANFVEPATGLKRDGSPFRVLSEAEEWSSRSPGSPRRAAINAFGFGGINAHVLLEEWHAEATGSLSRGPDASTHITPADTPRSLENIAIIGIGATLGGASSKPHLRRVFWKQDQLATTHTTGWGMTAEGTSGAPITEVTTAVDAFRIPPIELEEMLPQQLLMLQVAAAAIDDAGIPRELGIETGCFIGISLDPNATNFHCRWIIAEQAAEWARQLGLELSDDELATLTQKLRDTFGPALTANRVMGNLGGIVASRLAREFDVGGPCFTISSDEQSGAAALEVALRALQRGDLQQAVVGAVDLPSDIRRQIAATSDVPFIDGAVAFVLKRESDAIRAGDRIYAVIEADQPADTISLTWSPTTPVGSAGAVTSLLPILSAAWSLEAGMRPATSDQSAEPWLHNRCEGPRRARVESTGDYGTWSFTLREPSERGDVNPLGDSTRISVSPGELTLPRSPKLAFVFPGSGNHFLGMGRELLTACPEVLQRQDIENERLHDQYRPDVIWQGASTEAIGRDHKTMIFGQVALGTALCDLLERCGVRPQAVIGYSLGESAALFGLKAWRDRDEMLRRMEASDLFGGDLTSPFNAARKAWGIPQGQDVPWLSGVIDRSADEVRKVLERRTKAYLFIINTPSQCVIGGERGQIESLVKELGAKFIPFPAPSTVHCAILKEVGRDYVELHQMTTTPPEGIDFYSSATGQVYGLSRDAAAGAILAQAIDTVDFPRVIENAYRDGVRLFLEIGPGSSCTKMIDEILGERSHWARALCPATADPVGHARKVLSELAEQGVTVDLSPLSFADIEPSVTHSARAVITPTQGAPWQRDDDLTTPIKRTSAVTIPQRESTVSAISQPKPAPMPTANRPLPAPAPLPARSVSVASPSVPSYPTATAKLSIGEDISPALATWESWMTERIAAHEAFLRFSAQTQQIAAEMIVGESRSVEIGTRSAEQAQRYTHPVANVPPSTRPLPPSATPPRSLNYDQCMEFAIGSIGKVLGPKFAEIDQYPTRVRLPDIPLMLVDRILEIEGEPLSMTHGRVVTEHDIHADDWYLDCGRIPTCLAVESGQADLFLSGWLGIDFETRGLASYRLLDAVVTFHDALPGPGKTIHYDIRINSFFRQGDTWLFRFEFDATVNGQPLLTMRDGCAGFFTQQELQAGQGIIHAALDKQPRPGKRPDDWDDPVPLTIESYTDEQLTALRKGDLAACFGPVFDGLPLQQPVTLPSGRLNLVHRVLELDPAGGKYGIGKIRAEADIHPDDWFLTCHFCDDQVMPGTLMYECCLHTLRVYLLRMGWIGEAGEIAYEPVPGIKSRLKCRGQVLASTKTVWYEVTLKELGYGDAQRRPGIAIPGRQGDNSAFCIADALMYADGKPIVEITDMSVRLTGLTKEHVERLWTANTPGIALPGRPNPQPSTLNPQPLFDTDRITAFAIGKPSEAFGDRYRIFDEERTIARLPGPPFQFLDRITAIENCEPWVLAAGGEIVAEYDVPPDAWYFAANRSQTMPFAVLLETALQPCGWLAGYLGSALTSDVDLSFRNLGGKAKQLQPVTPQSGTLTTKVKITRVSQSAGMIIQHYDYDLRCNGEPVYVGNTYFGFFSKDALANQVGIRDAAVYQPTSEELIRAKTFPISLEPPFPDDQFCMVRRVDALVPDGGPHGLGYIRGSVDVDPSMWFFKAHFYQDPVWPGSLGLESFLQLLQIFAAEKWGAEGLGLRAQGSELMPAASTLSPWHLALSSPHEWVYRGQVIPRDKTVTVDVVVTAVDEATRKLTASGFLTVDGRVIYQMIDFAITMNPT